MKEVYRLIREKVIQTDTPDEYLSQSIQFYKEREGERGYCFLRSQISGWVGDIFDKETRPFRWLRLYFVFVGKKKVEDEALCNGLRGRLKGTVLTISELKEGGRGIK